MCRSILEILNPDSTFRGCVVGFSGNGKAFCIERPVPGDEEVLAEYWEDPPDVYGFGHIAYLKNVINVIENGARSLVDGLEGRKSLELISAIYEAIELGSEVRLGFKQNLGRLGRR